MPHYLGGRGVRKEGPIPLPGSAATIVQGVVHAGGAGGVRSRGQADWTLVFSLEPWREEGGALRQIRLHLDPGGGSLAGTLEAAKVLWRDQASWERRIRDYAVQELLELKNGTWLDDDEAEVSAAEFQRRMTLESVTVHADGAFEFFHDDGDLFFGHAIQVCGTLAEGPTDADIPG